jgi:hypothetical protein
MTQSTDPTSVSPAARAEEIGGLIDAYVKAATACDGVNLASKEVAAREAVDAAVAALVRERDEARRERDALRAEAERAGQTWDAQLTAERRRARLEAEASISGGPSHAP